MNKHEIALKNMVDLISNIDPVCSIFAEGSVGRGEYKPDSDIDLVVVTWRYKEIRNELEWQRERNLFDCENGLEVVLDTGLFQGIRLDLHCRSPRNHVNLIMQGPVYRWGGTRILYDPSGIAQWGVECIEKLLEDNPGFAETLKRFHDNHQFWKMDNSVEREFESQLAFGSSIDVSTLKRNYKTFANNAIQSDARSSRR